MIAALPLLRAACRRTTTSASMANLTLAFAATWVLTLAGGLIVLGGLGSLTAVRIGGRA